MSEYPLAHPTLWTVIEESPTNGTCPHRYRDPVEAQRYCDKLNRNGRKIARVLAPCGHADPRRD